MVDCSIGTPCDPPLPAVVEALGNLGHRARLSGVGRQPAAAPGRGGLAGAPLRVWPTCPRSSVAACVGTKELVASVPHVLRLRQPDRDTVLYPAVSYPTYAMGAELAGCRAVAVPAPAGPRRRSRPRRRSIPTTPGVRWSLWSNSPSNPTGGLGDLGAEAAWGRARGIPVFSDECYAEFTWDGPPRSILEHGTDGVVAVHSLSKRSNLAGVRVGFYAGDAELVEFLRAVRQHAGLMVPGPAQAAGVAALADDDARRGAARALSRAPALPGRGPRRPTAVRSTLPEGGFYLWVPVPAGRWTDAWAMAESLARDGGLLVSPG